MFCDKLPQELLLCPQVLTLLPHPSLRACNVFLCQSIRPPMGWSHSCIDYFIDSVQPLQAFLSCRKQNSSVTSVACSSPKRKIASAWKIKYCPWETCSRGWNKFIHAPPDPCKMPWFYSVLMSGGTKRSLCTTNLSLRAK